MMGLILSMKINNTLKIKHNWAEVPEPGQRGKVQALVRLALRGFKSHPPHLNLNINPIK